MAEIRATTAGTVWKIQVAVGDRVAVGDEVVILESMKMEIPVEAEQGGTVEAILVSEGETVQGDQPLLTVTGEGAGA